MADHRRPQRDGLHPVVTTTVVLTLLGLLAYNVVIVGPEGYPTSVILGGLLGTYAGVDQLVRKLRGERDDEDKPKGG